MTRYAVDTSLRPGQIANLVDDFEEALGELYVAFLIAADLFYLVLHLRIVGFGGDRLIVVGCVLLLVEQGIELFG